MKKMIILMIPLLFLIGCESKEEEFSKTCTKKVNSKDIVDISKTKVIYNNKDEVTKLIITKEYKAKNSDGNIVIDGIKKTLENYNNNLAKSKNINVKNIKMEDDIYIVKHYLNVKEMTKKELKSFDIRKNSIKYFNKLKKENVECKA